MRAGFLIINCIRARHHGAHHNVNHAVCQVKTALFNLCDAGKLGVLSVYSIWNKG